MFAENRQGGSGQLENEVTNAILKYRFSWNFLPCKSLSCFFILKTAGREATWMCISAQDLRYIPGVVL